MKPEPLTDCLSVFVGTDLDPDYNGVTSGLDVESKSAVTDFYPMWIAVLFLPYAQTAYSP